MRKRYKDAGITLEQIIDGTTGCHIWFHIDVAERECFMSEEEQIDGSVILNISGIEDWATIPPDFYQLGGREVRGANTCIFGSFIAEGKTYTLLKSIPAQEVVEQAFFESWIVFEHIDHGFVVWSAFFHFKRTEPLIFFRKHLRIS